MKYAFSVSGSGLTLVDIDDLDSSSSEPSVFRCPDVERCRAFVSPVFPADRAKYFARHRTGEQHSDNCQRDKNIPGHARRGHARLDESAFPSRFVELDTSPHAGGPAADRADPALANGTAVEQRSTCHLVDIVRAFEQMDVAQRSGARLKLPGCPGKTYDDAFRSVEEYRNDIARCDDANHYVYYAECYFHTRFRSGRSIFLRPVAHHDGYINELAVWIDDTLGPNEHASLCRLLEHRKPRRYMVYAFGCFTRFSENKVSIELKNLSRLCIINIA